MAELISRGLAEAHLLGETFVHADPSEPVVDQIDHGWDRYGEELNMGDVAYLSITTAGRAKAKPWPA